MSLADYADKWIKDRPVKARTRLLYESQLKLHIKPRSATWRSPRNAGPGADVVRQSGQ